MRFLKILFWLFLGLGLLFFMLRNWQDVTLNLWGGLVLDVKAPALMLVIFLAGMLFQAMLRALRERRRFQQERQRLIDAREEAERSAAEAAPTPTPETEDPF